MVRKLFIEGETMLTLNKKAILKVGGGLTWSDEYSGTGVVSIAQNAGITEIILTEILGLFGEDYEIVVKERLNDGNVIFWTTVPKETIVMLSMIPDTYEIALEKDEEFFSDDVEEPEDGRWNWFGTEEEGEE